MNKLIWTSIITFGLMLIFPFISFAQQNVDYEKYGRIAMAVVREDYPGQDIVEYEYVGRDKKQNQEVSDTFRFEVLVDGKKTFVDVVVTHSLKNNKLLSLTVKQE